MSKRGRGVCDMELGSLDTARLLMLLAQHQQQRAVAGAAQATSMSGRVFECKTCNRQFPTFQALGGHRASHKRPRLHHPPPQRAPVGVDDDAALCLGRRGPQAPPQPPRPRVHECPVCGLEFAVGQALGGHMRRHRVEAEAGARAPSDELAAPETVLSSCDAGGICLDLNLTPSENCAKCRSAVAATGQGVHKVLGGHMRRHRADGEAEAHATSGKDFCDKLGRRLIVQLAHQSPLGVRRQAAYLSDVMERGFLDVDALTSSVTIEHVMPVSDMTIEPSLLAPTTNPDAVFAKELCDLLAGVEFARPGLGRWIARLLTGRQ